MSYHPLTNTIASLYLREGSVFANDNEDVHRARINWELNSGQWVLLTGENNALLAWASYYLVDEETANKLHLGADELVRNGEMVQLRDGNVVYIATIVIAPWAEPGIAKELYKMIKALNPKADSIAWSHHKIASNFYHKKIKKRVLS